ncbi:MAG TPA: NmrA family NAD(P)-binding protein [Vicinamibacterales bacterium]|nr:NmrA family NAD(P)-binding protein [Vicinamibacterales bacterium]
MYAVAGVTGHTGRAAAEALLRQGATVRAIVRDQAKGAEWRSRGAEVVVAALDDAAALTRALTGVRAAYLLVPPPYSQPDPLDAQRRLADAIAEAIVASAIPHVVLLSSIGAQHAAGVGPIRGLHAAEARLTATGAPVTFMRSAYFAENWAAAIPVVKAQQVLPSFIPLDLAVETIATADVGACAAHLLRGPAPAGSAVVEIGGVRPTTPRELAEDLSRLIGRGVSAVEAPLDQVAPTFTSAGFSDAAAALMREMYEGLASGLVGYADPRSPSWRGKRRPIDVLAPLTR